MDNAGGTITELSTHLRGQLVAVPSRVRHVIRRLCGAPARARQPSARTEWAIEQLKLAAVRRSTSRPRAHVSFSGALAWPYLYPWPQRPAGLVEAAFDELARRWTPILNAFDAAGVERLLRTASGRRPARRHTLERFLDAVKAAPARQHSLRPEPFRSAATRAGWRSSTFITNASRRFV